MKFAIIIPAMIMAQACLAQGSRALRCPVYKRERTFVPKPTSYLDLSAGVLHSFMYRNAGGKTGMPFKFASKPAPYLAVTEHYVFSPKLELLAGLAYTQSVQGLKMKLSDHVSTYSDNQYSGSLIASLSLGLSYAMRPGWQVAATPYAAYTELSSTMSSGHGSGSGGPRRSLNVNWADQTFFTKFYLGTGLSTRISITRKWSTTILGAVDFEPAVPTTGTIELAQNGKTVSYTGHVEPYLFYAGIVLSYRIWQQGRFE